MDGRGKERALAPLRTQIKVQQIWRSTFHLINCLFDWDAAASKSSVVLFVPWPIQTIVMVFPGKSTAPFFY